MVRGLISFVAVGLAVIIQLTIVDRIAFPGGTGPDVVLLAVAALAVAGGPLTGVLIGFWAGLALDVAPPGSHLVGQNALVFCLVGYLCGLAADVPNREGVPEQGHTALFEIVITAAGAVLGEVLAALLGVMLSDPQVTWPAIRHVLPVAVAYDLLLCPFVLYAAAAVLRLAGTPTSAVQAWGGGPPAQARGVPGGRPQGLTQNTPRLRLSEHGKADGLGGSALSPRAGGLATARHEPRLKLGHGGPLGTSTLGAAFAVGGFRQGSGLASGTMAGALGGSAAKVKFAARRGEGMLGGSWGGFGGASRALNSNLARAGLPSSRFGRSRMGRSLLGGSVFSRSPSALRPSPPPRRLAPMSRSSFLGRSPAFGRSPFLGRSPASGRSPFLGRSPAFGRSPALGRPLAPGRPSSSGRSPALGRSLSVLRSPALGRAPSLGRTSALGRALAPRRTSGRMRSGTGGPAAGFAPRRRPGPLARLTGALRTSVRRQPRLRMRRTAAFRQPIRTKSPGRGWLRRSSPRRGTMGGSRTGDRTPRLGTSTPRLHMASPRVRRRSRTGGYR